MKLWEIIAVLVYLLMVVYLGYLGWKRTKSASDYMLAGRKAHPAIMALSYGSPSSPPAPSSGSAALRRCSA